MLGRAIDALAMLGARIAGLLSLVCLVLVGSSVAWRYFLNRPQSWIDEAATWLVIGMVLLAVPEVQRRGDHIGVDALVLKLKPAGQKRLAFFSALSVAVVAGMMIQSGIETVQFSAMLGIKAQSFAWLPMWWIQALLPIGGALLLLVALGQLLAILTGRWQPATDADAIEHATRSHE